MTKVALRVHEVLGLRDLSRIDAIVDDEGQIYVLEANVAPGMTETSLLPLAVEVAKLDLAKLCRELVEQAAARGASPPLAAPSRRLRPTPSPFSPAAPPESAPTADQDPTVDAGREPGPMTGLARASSPSPVPRPDPGP